MDKSKFELTIGKIVEERAEKFGPSKAVQAVVPTLHRSLRKNRFFKLALNPKKYPLVEKEYKDMKGGPKYYKARDMMRIASDLMVKIDYPKEYVQMIQSRKKIMLAEKAEWKRLNDRPSPRKDPGSQNPAIHPADWYLKQKNRTGWWDEEEYINPPFK